MGGGSRIRKAAGWNNFQNTDRPEAVIQVGYGESTHNDYDVDGDLSGGFLDRKKIV